MPNSLASFKVTLTYPSGGGSVSIPAQSLDVPFQGESVNTIDVPALEAMTTSHAVSFGSVAAATGVLVKNDTGQDLDVKINGAAAVSHSIPDGGVMFIGGLTEPTTPISSMALITTEAQGATAGQIYTWVFGDMT